MMTIRKLAKQEDKLILRKSVKILTSLELEGLQQEDGFLSLRRRYIGDLMDLLTGNPLVDAETRKLLEQTRMRIQDEANCREAVVLLSDARYVLMSLTGEQVGDWDMHEGRGAGRSAARDIRPFAVYADRVRSPFNIGSVFRTSESFGVEKIYLHPSCASPLHTRARRSAMGCTDHVHWEFMEDARLITEPVFALETGGMPIDEFEFPRSGTVIIGSEELGVSPGLLKAADRSLGRVTIPTAGLKGSLNLSIAFGILMYTWYWSTASGHAQLQGG